MSRRLHLVVWPLVVLAALAAAPAPATIEFTDYLFGFLSKGPGWTPGRTARTDSIQAGHMANIGHMHDTGLLIAAGPFEQGVERRGVFVFRADSVARVSDAVANDPAVATRRLQLDVYHWNAPAGLGVRYDAYAARPGHRDSMIARPFALLRYGPKFQGFGDAATMRDLGAHGARLMQLFQDGTLATGGSFAPGGPDSTLAGVLVFRADSAAARRVMAADPAVKAGRFTVEWDDWWTAWGTFPGDTL